MIRLHSQIYFLIYRIDHVRGPFIAANGSLDPERDEDQVISSFYFFSHNVTDPPASWAWFRCGLGT